MSRDWRLDAACVGLPLEVFFPAGDVVTPDAEDACAICPVRAECLAYATDLDNPQKFGVWGGATEQERFAIRRTMQRRASKEAAA